MSLKKSTLNGIVWTFIQQLSTQSITFIVSIILARLLMPSEFGLIALLGIFITLSDVLINGGLTHSLIRTENPDNDDFSTVFYFNIIISSFIYLICYFGAPFIADFYHQPLLVNIMRIYCLVFITNALSMIQNTRLAKAMDFKKQTIITIPSLIIGSIVGITLAFKGFGVWSLVWSAITRSTALSIQLWWWSPWVPSFRFKKEKIKAHLGFGYKLTIAGIIDAIFTELYTIVIGKLFNPMQVGFYNRANTLRQMPVKNFTAVLNAVTFPLFSKIQHNDAQLKGAYKKILQMSVFLIAPTLLFMATLAEPLFRFLFTEKWLPAVPYFQILCFNGILYPIHAYNLNLLTVKGRSDIFLRLEIIKKTMVAVVLVISLKWGIYGLLYGNVATSVVGLFLNTYYTGKYINYKPFEQLKDLFPAFLIALFSSGIVLYVDNWFSTVLVIDIIRLIMGSLLGLSIYLGLAYVLKFSSLNEISTILFAKFKKLKTPHG